MRYEINPFIFWVYKTKDGKFEISRELECNARYGCPRRWFVLFSEDEENCDDRLVCYNGFSTKREAYEWLMRSRFGQIVATPGALRILEDEGQTPEFFLERHVSGSWGDIHKNDVVLNEEAIIDGSRIMSAYKTLKGKELWVITDACGESGEREVTTLLLPEDY